MRRTVLDTEFGKLIINAGWYRVDLESGDATGNLDAPDRDRLTEATFQLSSSYLDETGLANAVDLVRFAQQLVGLLNAATHTARAEAEAKRQQEREEAEASRQRAEEAVKERSDRLLNEFLEEKGRIRLRGMKRWRPVTVEARQLGQETYEAFFRYHYAKHGHTERMGRHVVCFEVKVGSRFKSVWDDGQDDLHEWDRKHDRKVTRYDGEL